MNPDSVSVLMTTAHVSGGAPASGPIRHLLSSGIQQFRKFTCRNCGGGDRGRVALYRPFGEVSLSLNRTVTCMVLKANDRRTSCPCHDEFRGPHSDYVRQKDYRMSAVYEKCYMNKANIPGGAYVWPESLDDFKDFFVVNWSLKPVKYDYEIHYALFNS
ncbi:uncharacterized protein TNCV_4314821 [Trichonephila clavipes]|nr:uncharacterized protein TNCV_4314821 [Trichonephila clavipes]